MSSCTPATNPNNTDNDDKNGNGVIDLFCPGRICLFGEHSDWAGSFRSASTTNNYNILVGKCLIAGTNQGLYVQASLIDNGEPLLQLTSTLNNGKAQHVTIDASCDDILQREATKGTHWSYICGTYLQVKKAYPTFFMNKNNKGLRFNNYKTTLPIKKGLSSSAAICVLTVRALAHLHALHPPLSIQEEMELAYLGERSTQHSNCGRMDQGCAYGPSNILLMTFDGNQLDVSAVEEVNTALYLILVDLGASKSTPAILADLQECYTNNDDSTNSTDKIKIKQGVQRLLGPINHEIMDRALQALKDGNAQVLGETMTMAQAQFDQYAIPASPQHLTSPVLHSLLNHDDLTKHCWGGKGVGSQGDGSAQFVAKSKEHQMAAIKLIETEFANMQCLALTLGKNENE